MFRYLVAIVLTAALIPASHAAEAKKSSDAKPRMALFVSNVFNESNDVFGLLGLPNGPSYHAGMFLSDQLLAYGTVRLTKHEEGTNYGFGGGARMYTSRPAPLRTFFDGSLDYVKISGLGDPTGTAAGSLDASIMTLGGFFGAEYMFSKSASIGAKIGASYIDYGKDFNFSTLDIGVTEVQFNLYF